MHLNNKKRGNSVVLTAEPTPAAQMHGVVQNAANSTLKHARTRPALTRQRTDEPECPCGSFFSILGTRTRAGGLRSAVSGGGGVGSAGVAAMRTSDRCGLWTSNDWIARTRNNYSCALYMVSSVCF